jgi:glucose/mannose-6-phosphate isomerase
VTSIVSDLTSALDDRAVLTSADPYGACAVLADFPAQCRAAVRIEPRLLPAVKRPRVVVIAGMGGSAAAADLVAGCAAADLEIPVVVHRGYGLPSVAWDDALVVAVSYSGSTAEVLSAADMAIARRVPLIVVASGGALGALAAKRGLGYVEVPAGLMPRMALGYLFFPMARALHKLGIEVVAADDVDEALREIDALGRELAPEQPTARNEAKRVALAIESRWPAVYGGPVTGAVAYRWKTDLEENAKTFALSGALPEMNHNTIEAWRAPLARQLQLVLLRDPQEAPEIRRRFELLEELVRDVAGGVTTCWARGRGPLARLLSLAYLGQWVSYYLAILRGIDPWTVPQLDEIKRRLSD